MRSISSAGCLLHGETMRWSDVGRVKYGMRRDQRVCVACGRTYDHGGRLYCCLACCKEGRQASAAERAARRAADAYARPRLVLPPMPPAPIVFPACPVCGVKAPLLYRGTCSEYCLRKKVSLH